MNIGEMLKISKKYIKDSVSIDDLTVNIYTKTNTSSGKETLICELNKYTEDGLEANSIIPLFEITESIGVLFLKFINLDLRLLNQLLNNLETIKLYDNITAGYIADNTATVIQDMYLNERDFEHMDNSRIANSTCTILSKLFELHPYMVCFFYDFARLSTFYHDPIDTIPYLSMIIKQLRHIITLITECRKIVDFTFCHQEDYPELEEYDCMTKYYIYTRYIIDYHLNFPCPPTNHFEFVYSKPPKPITNQTNINEVIGAFRNTQTFFEPLSYLDIGYGSNTCAEAIIKIIQQDLRIQKCRLCNNYYFLNGKRKSNYCTSIYKNTGKTCQQVAAQNNHKKKKKNNPIFQEYDRAYKRNYARVTNQKMTAEDFRLWTEEATKKRDALSAEYDSSPSDQLIADFKQYLGNK